MTNGESRLVPPPSGRMRTGTSRSSRYLMAALLILVAVIGLRAGKPAVSWRGPLRTEGFSLALTVEAILAVLFIVLWRRGRSAPRPGHPAATIRVVLRRTIAVSMLAVVFLVLAGLVGLPFDKTHINPIYVPGGLIAFVTNQMYTAMGTRSDEYEHARDQGAGTCRRCRSRESTRRWSRGYWPLRGARSGSTGPT